ncbi:ABC transporter-like protein [Flavobacterium saliperosum S13]|uniref:ATP-binding cassette, subfamily B, MsbA n=2 Tax=Flavobacterium saliperosum TaxID=329186 RepID=A0A1G4V292_9FLAO|nr:ABC transporter ATP-binding protein [Flavobacterium saliperosum]ESU28627.1 ABC transporter-like protein [Flavobacterium saliperosum S13]SCX00091.1 ATP-binding cassette, subfamily B, MsbA [Flavobacterium saliperosum]
MNSTFFKILRYALPYKKYAFLNIFFNILYALFSTLSFVMLIPMLNVMFDKTKRVSVEPVYKGLTNLPTYSKEYLDYIITITSDQKGPEYSLLLMVVLVISMFLLKNIFNYLAMYNVTFLRNGTLKDLRIALYEKVIHLPLSFYSEKRRGDVMIRLTNDVGEVQFSFLSILEIIIKEPLTIVFTIISMFYISTKLTLFVFVFIPLSGLLISFIGKSLKRKSGRVQKEAGIFLSILDETLGGLKIVKSYNAENSFQTKFNASAQNLYRYSNSLVNRNNLSTPISEFLGIVVIAILLWFGGNMVLIEKTLEGTEFIAYMGLAYGILTPAKAISKASYTLKGAMAAADRVLEILEQENTITNKPDAIVKSNFEDKISIQNINFRYEDENVLKNFSLEVPKGKTVALVGQSGSGKSTIANLLTRFYDVQEGIVKVDGIDIKDMNMHSLRGLMGLVTQDSILFNDSIKNNILLGKEDATDEEIIAALKVANAYEFVKDLPNGIETNIGDAGNKLSGGQKQRLSIARAVLKNPPIMILDEATSALDTESERLVQQALENMMQNRTSIVIAHRLSTIQKADTIVVMLKGEIVEQGTHDELLAKNGTYSKLVMMQSFE